MPLPDDRLRDPRIRRTRRLLQDSLRTLLQQKPLDEILVQEITDAAEVNRATFYDHYGDKFDLFNELIGADFQKLLEERNVCFDGSCTSGLSAIVLAVGDFLEQIHRDQMACARRVSSGPLIDAAVTLAVRRIVLEGLQKEGRQFSIPREVLASLVSGALHSAVRESLSEMNWRADEAALRSLVPVLLPLLEQHPASPHSSASSSRKRAK
jgi:AcrR family transcriptional regulator